MKWLPRNKDKDPTLDPLDQACPVCMTPGQLWSLQKELQPPGAYRFQCRACGLLIEFPRLGCGAFGGDPKILGFPE